MHANIIILLDMIRLLTSDENECKYRPCDVFAHCTNTMGSFYCSCFPGYDGDGFTCHGKSSPFAPYYDYGSFLSQHLLSLFLPHLFFFVRLLNWSSSSTFSSTLLLYCSLSLSLSSSLSSIFILLLLYHKQPLTSHSFPSLPSLILILIFYSLILILVFLMMVISVSHAYSSSRFIFRTYTWLLTLLYPCLSFLKVSSSFSYFLFLPFHFPPSSFSSSSLSHCVSRDVFGDEREEVVSDTCSIGRETWRRIKIEMRLTEKRGRVQFFSSLLISKFSPVERQEEPLSL